MGVDEKRPRGGADYPRNWSEFQAWFSGEAECIAYLERLRWPDGFRCPSCGGARAWRTNRGLWVCAGCQRQTSVTAGTIFDKTRTPLRTWFATVWHVTGQKTGVSALGLQHVMGFSYETAWAHLHKLRRAMVRPGRDRLRGDVEVDETYVGGEEQGRVGRSTLKKAIVVIAIDSQAGQGLGRVRLDVVEDASQASLEEFVQRVVEKGSRVRTDAWSGYSRLVELGYDHVVINVSNTGDPAHVAMPAVHQVASLVKRWLLGTHQGSVALWHLPYYLDEYTFRFNRRRSRHRGLLFYRLLEQAVDVAPVTLHQIRHPATPEINI